MIRTLLIAAAAAVLAVGAADPAVCQTDAQIYGANVLGTRAPNQVQEKWTYTLANTSDDANYTVWLLQIEVDEGTEVLSATKPANWAFDLSVPHFVTWIATGEGLLKGEFNTAFGITFSTAPQYQNWSAMFNNIGDPNECPSDGGVIRTAAVPEPTSLAAVLFGLGTFIRLKKKSKA